MTKLDEICGKKREHVSVKKHANPIEKIKEQVVSAAKPLSFSHALRTNGPALIAEVKKASPSKGIIRADFNPVEIAKIYEANGANCLSVLTDEPYFQGHDEYLLAVKKTVQIPVLRKDFIIDEYQVYESRSLNADCILLIMAALSDAQAQEFHILANELGMDVLVEIHDQAELERARKLKPAMIGVNNRNLKTLHVDVNTSRLLAPLISDTCIKIAESGIGDHNTVKELHKLGYQAFLVGESLMREIDVGQAVRALIGK